MGSKSKKQAKKRRHNSPTLGAIAKMMQSLQMVATALNGVSAHLENLFALTGHTVQESNAILERKAKENGLKQGESGNAGSPADMVPVPGEAEQKEPISPAESAV